MKDCTTCKYGYEDERLGIPMCHHPKRFSEDCVDFNMHEEKEIKESEKPVPNGLEEAATITLDEAESVADEYTGFLEKGLIENQPRPIGGKWFIKYARKRFIAGAKWQKEQMMKEAVEYEVGMHGEPIKITFDKYVQRARGIFPGDKVRIIIVKENEQC